MEYFRSEVKAGIMIVACAAIFAILIFSIGDFGSLKRTYPLYVRFKFAGALDEKAPVRYAGVEAGQVEEIRIIDADEANVEVCLRINENIKLRRDSQAFISTTGVMGEKYIELTPGTKGEAVLEPGSIISGSDPVRMDELFEKGSKVADELDKAVIALQRFLEDADDLIVANREDIRRIVIDLQLATENAKKFTRTISENPWKLIRKTKEKEKDDEGKTPSRGRR